MDPKALREVIGPKIDKYAATVPPRLREDFVQDMWVFALDGLIKAFETSTAPMGEIKGDIDLALFRRRESWVGKAKRRAGCEQPEEASLEPSAPSQASARVDAKQALRGLVKSLEKARYSPEDIQTVIQGLCDGLHQKEIAERVGRSPQLFFIHIKNFRSVA